MSGERGRNRTYNLLIKSQLLCQLSYASPNRYSNIRNPISAELSPSPNPANTISSPRDTLVGQDHMFRSQQRKTKILFGLSDAILTFAAFELAYVLRESLPFFSHNFFLQPDTKSLLLIYSIITWSAPSVTG